jgi:hypothetical protein
VNQPPGPRFTGPTQARQRIRLAAAIGFLAITAIGVGGLASLAGERPEAGATIEPVGTARGSAPGPSSLLDHGARLELEVREAEQAVTRARAAISSARQLGNVDPALLLEFERRLERLGESPLDSVRRTYGSTGSDGSMGSIGSIGSRGSPADEDRERQRRPHLRAIAPAPRQL